MNKIESLISSKRVLETLAFCVPLLYCLELHWIGQLYLNELLFLILLPALLYYRFNLLTHRLTIAVLIILGTWLLAQIFTDMVRGITFHDYARGWAKIAFTAINFCAMYLLVCRNRRRLVIMACGFALGGILHYLLSNDPNIIDIPWQLGYGEGVTWLIVAASLWWTHDGKSRRVWLAILPIVIASILNFYMGYRSMGGILFITACYLAFQCTQRYSASAALGIGRSLAIGVLGLVAAVGALKAYEYSATQGWLGAKEQTRVSSQAHGAYGLLLGGRFEIIVSSQVVADSPILGQGSWAKDCRYRDLYDQLKRDAGYTEVWGSCVIPSHSYLMGAWVETGIIGAVAWLLFTALTIWALLTIHIRRDRLAPLAVFAGLWLLWNILFSPFAGAARFSFPFTLILLLAHLPNRGIARPASKRIGAMP